MEKKRQITVALGGALLVAVYGADFSWRQVLIDAVALFLWMVGEKFWNRAFARQPSKSTNSWGQRPGG
jgi:hypothetical protein